MRLIDADKLTQLCDIMADKCDGIGESVWHQFRTTVEWSPTVDAVPVKHAKLLDASPWGLCSECGFMMDYRDKFNYCPNCGARMDGEENG